MKYVLRIAVLILAAPSWANAQASSAAQVFAFADLAPPNLLTTCPRFKGGAGDSAPSAPVPSVPAAGSASAQSQQVIDAINKQLATMRPGDPGYDQIKSALAKVGQAPAKLAQAEASANAPAARPVEYVRMDFAAAVASVRARLKGTVSPKAWAYYQANQAINNPAKANTAAIIAMTRGNRLAATAVLLRNVERNPSDVTAIVNLAALMAVMGAPNEALALLTEADRLGTQPRTAWSLNPGAVKLNTRGYALMGVGRDKEAENLLRQSVGLESQLAEAKRNLAAALGEQGKCAEGVRLLRLGAQRNPPSGKAPPVLPPTPTATPSSVISSPFSPPGSLETRGRKPARDVLDFSRGRNETGWPYFPVNVAPSDVPRIRRLLAQYKAFHGPTLDASIGLALHESSMKAIERSQSYFDDSRNGYLTGMWVSYLVAESAGSNDRVLMTSEKAWRAAFATYLDGEKTSATTLERKRAQSRLQEQQELRACNEDSYCRKKADYDHDVRVCQAVRDWNDLWRGSIAYAEKSARSYDGELNVYFGTLTSYFSDPILQARPRSIYRVQRQIVLRSVADLIYDHLSALQSANGPCLRVDKNPPPALPSESIGDDATADMPGCKGDVTQKGSLGVRIATVEISGNCEKMGVEASIGMDVEIFDFGLFVSVEEQPVGGARPKAMTKEQRASERAKGFNPYLTKFEDLQARKDHSSDFTVFLGGKAAIGAKSGVGGNAEVKEGVFFTVHQGMINNAGAKVQTSATSGTEFRLPPGKVAIGVEIAGPESTVSFVPDNGL
jgi:tetratricopeptide (TPR) repeat protein